MAIKKGIHPAYREKKASKPYSFASGETIDSGKSPAQEYGSASTMEQATARISQQQKRNIKNMGADSTIDYKK